MKKIEEIGNELSIPKEFIFSVTEINQAISEKIEETQKIQNTYVLGEITNLNKSSKGNFFFDLKDEKSLISCVLFNYKSNKIKTEINEGEEVLIQGSVGYYRKKGNLSLKVNNIYPVGIGKYYKQKKELKEKLKKEGLFKSEHKKEIPKIPEKIGIVTSTKGDAIKDIVKSIKDRYHEVNILIKNSSVQGENAPQELVQGIEHFEEKTDVDLIITGRGGGNIEDLQAFNSEELARKIFNSKKPIITGIGHKEDETIAGLVADKKTITPTEAGKEAVPKKEELIENLDKLEKELNETYNKFKKIKKQGKEIKKEKKSLKTMKVAILLLILIILILIGVIL